MIAYSRLFLWPCLDYVCVHVVNVHVVCMFGHVGRKCVCSFDRRTEQQTAE